jgi:hypothetical protein
MTPNSANARRNIEHVTPRTAGNGVRIRSLLAESSRNQVCFSFWANKASTSRGTPAGAPRRGRQCAYGSSQAGASVRQKHYQEHPIAGAVWENMTLKSMTLWLDLVRCLFHRGGGGVPTSCLRFRSCWRSTTSSVRRRRSQT